MKWVPDRTGRFGERPHFDPDEIEATCSLAIGAFSRKKYGRTFEPPWDTEDLKIFLEAHTQSLDLYAPLQSREGPDVEGVTTFRPDVLPLVEIDASLTEDPRRENRLRTTISHELTHVLLHRAVWELLWQRNRQPQLFGPGANATEYRGQCRRDSVLGARATDWMEWQAGYGSGAILMPRHHVIQLVATQNPPLEGDLAVEAVRARFHVSSEAARVRLSVLGLLRPPGAPAQTSLI